MENQSSYYKNLIKQVLESSGYDTWKSAVTEWEIDDVEEDENQIKSCICGKENLRYLYTIRNKLNDNLPYPIRRQLINKLDMFNTWSQSEKEDKKATAIMLNSIKPFLQVQLAEKVRK